MTDTITVRGFAGTDPQLRSPESSNQVASFRVGSTPRWRDAQSGEWVSGETNWYTVAAFGRLAENTAHSIRKGDPVVIVGRPKVRSWTSEAGGSGTDVEINAQAVAHDLNFGYSRFAKVASTEASAESGNQDHSGDGAASATGGAAGHGADQGSEHGADPSAHHSSGHVGDSESGHDWSAERSLEAV